MTNPRFYGVGMGRRCLRADTRRAVEVNGGSAPSEAPVEPTAKPKAGGRSSRMRGGKLALLAFAVAAMAATALARTCDHKVDPTQDDAAAPDSCSDDAVSCVALA
jgi:hypothetical protein